MTCDEPVVFDSQSVGCDVCITKLAICHTFLSYKMGCLSYNCITFQGFCNTFLSYKIGVLSYKFKIEIVNKSSCVNFSSLSSYGITSHLYTMIPWEKKDKGGFSKSILYYIVIHFSSEHILILFSSSLHYCYYYYYYIT